MQFLCLNDQTNPQMCLRPKHKEQSSIDNYVLFTYLPFIKSWHCPRPSMHTTPELKLLQRWGIKWSSVTMVCLLKLSIYMHVLFVHSQWGLSVYLQSVINQSQDVLDCLLLGDVGHQVQKGLCALSNNKTDINKLRKTHHKVTAPMYLLTTASIYHKGPWDYFIQAAVFLLSETWKNMYRNGELLQHKFDQNIHKNALTTKTTWYLMSFIGQNDMFLLRVGHLKFLDEFTVLCRDHLTPKRHSHISAQCYYSLFTM